MTVDIAALRNWIPEMCWPEVALALADSIEVAHQSAPDRWGLRYDGSIMLKVGPHEVFQIGRWERPCHLVVDRSLVPREVRDNSRLWFSGDQDWKGNLGKAGYYSSNPGTEAVRCDFGKFGEMYRALAPAHYAAVRRAAKLRRHPSIVASHSSELLLYVSSETGRALHSPVYDTEIVRDRPTVRFESASVETRRELAAAPQEATIHAMLNPPSAEEYIRAFRALEPRVGDTHRRLFAAHHAAPDRTTRARDLAVAVGVQSHAQVNSAYGKLGRQISDFLRIAPEMRSNGESRWWTVLSEGWSTPDGFVWRMLPQVAEALERMGWVPPSTTSAMSFASPDELPAGLTFYEGATRRVVVNAYERSVEARAKCIEFHGALCCICNFDFASAYGIGMRGYIHVHHLRRISEIGEEYRVDPIADLRPVCPNCHAVIHSREPPYTIEQMQKLVGAGPAEQANAADRER